MYGTLCPFTVAVAASAGSRTSGVREVLAGDRHAPEYEVGGAGYARLGQEQEVHSASVDRTRTAGYQPRAFTFERVIDEWGHWQATSGRSNFRERPGAAGRRLFRPQSRASLELLQQDGATVRRFVVVSSEAKRVNPLVLLLSMLLAAIALAAPFASSAAARARCNAKGRAHKSAAKRCPPKVAPRKCRTARRGKRHSCKVKAPPKHGGPQAPPAPVTFPSEPPGYNAPTGLVGGAAPSTTSSTPPQAKTWGAPGKSTTLVVYDSTNTWGWLGAVYGTDAGNLAAHFGQVTAEPVVDYIAGQVNNYTATIYIGSTYDEPIPIAFLDDVLTTTHPVIWAGYNAWQLSGTRGSAEDAAFVSKYGWDPSSSYIDTTDDPLSVSYGAQNFTRDPANGADIVSPHITSAADVTVLAQANCTSSTGAAVKCAAIAQSTGTSFPWAIRSGNVTHIGEEPFSYTSATDRYQVFADLVSAILG
jgi:hypothetical protein